MNKLATLKLLLLAASMTILWSCSSTEEVKGDGIIDLVVNIEISEDANPDDSGRASPVFLQLFELRSTSALNRAEYLDVFRDARRALGPDLLNTTEIGPLFPGSKKTEKLRLDGATTAVGIIGEFNRYDEMQNSQTLYVEPGMDREISIRINGSGIFAE